MEENILKKANQKRMLGDMAIDGGNFTTAFFKEVGVHPHYSGTAGCSFSLHINRCNNHLFWAFDQCNTFYIDFFHLKSVMDITGIDWIWMFRLECTCMHSTTQHV